MPTVANFIETAKAALVAGDAEEAALVCRHVLSHYPKHVEATCLLAEALRDQGETSLARDLYLRVVSADPNNLIAHWALGLIAEAENDLEWATWELQRAFESHPGNAELRQELQRLGESHPSTTEFALAQTYAASGLADRAVEELRKILATEPTRLDAAVALAETLWRDGQRQSAARVCESILEDSPDCLRANLLLGGFLAKGSAESRERGKLLLRRALALDPSGAVASELLVGEDLPDVLSPPPAEIPDLDECADFATSNAATGPAERPMAETTADPGQASSPASATRARSRTQSDIAGWLQDGREQQASVQEVLQSRLASHAARRPDADWQAIEGLDPEWQDLLADDISLDPEAEERLSSALSDMGLAQPGHAEEGWVEVPVSVAGAHRHVAEVARAQSSASASTRNASPRPPAEARTEPLPPVAPAQSDPSLIAASRPRPAGGQSNDGGPEWATALWRAGDPEAALEEYRRVLASSPEAAEQVAEGLKDLMRAYPDLPAAHRVLGDAYMRSGRFQQAIEEYNWVLSNRNKA